MTGGSDLLQTRAVGARTVFRSAAQSVPAFSGQLSVATVEIEATAVRMANEDLGSAIEWWEGLPEEPAKTTAGLAIAYEASRDHPLDALRLLSQFPQSSERDEAVVHATRQWAEMDAEEAANWCSGVPDPLLRAKLLSAVATSWAELDGTKAALLVASNVGDREEQARAAVAVAQRWAQSQPEAALAWVSAFPEVRTRLAAFEAITSETGNQE